MFELHVAVHELCVRDAQCAGSERAGADTAVFAKEDAVGVDENDLPVGVELTEDGAGLLTDDAVQEHRGTAGLDHIDASLGADVEALPVDDRFVAALIDAQLSGVGLAQGDMALLNGCACGQGLGPSALAKKGPDTKHTDSGTEQRRGLLGRAGAAARAIFATGRGVLPHRYQRTCASRKHRFKTRRIHSFSN